MRLLIPLILFDLHISLSELIFERATLNIVNNEHFIKKFLVLLEAVYLKFHVSAYC